MCSFSCNRYIIRNELKPRLVRSSLSYLGKKVTVDIHYLNSGGFVKHLNCEI